MSEPLQGTNPDSTAPLHQTGDAQARPEGEQRVDSTADVEAAAKAVSPELARDIRERQEEVARKRRRAAANSDLLNRRIG